MAQLEGALGRHKQARGYFFEVLDIIEAEEGKPLKGEVLANLANDYSLDRDLLNSLKTYDKALETLLERKSASDAYTLEAPQSTEQSRVAILPKRTPVTEALSQVRGRRDLCANDMDAHTHAPFTQKGKWSK